MASELRQKLRQRRCRCRKTASSEFQNQTGINIETDIDRVVAVPRRPTAGTRRRPGAGMVLARGRFDEVKIEALMREHGAHVEDYKGKRLIVADVATSTTHDRRSAAHPHDAQLLAVVHRAGPRRDRQHRR